MIAQIDAMKWTTLTTMRLIFDPYKLSKITTLNTLTPSTGRTRIGTKISMIKRTYNIKGRLASNRQQGQSQDQKYQIIKRPH